MAFGVVAVLVVFQVAALTVSFTDYEQEALPAISSLLGGHLGDFLAQLPAYGGSVILRAPAALLANALGGSELTVFHAMAVPCLVAALAFGVVLWAELAPAGRRAGVAAWLALALIIANPVILPALDIGHPEELLGAVLCAAAVFAAQRDRPLLAGVLLGLAGANKAWALLAVIPVLLALRGGRLTALATAVGVCGLVLAPMLLHGSHAVAQAGVARDTGTVFQPWQAWWFFGAHGATVHGLAEVKVGYRTGPAWLSAIAHPIVLGAPLALAAAVATRGRRQDALLLLAACLLLRCLLDPWNNAYYHLPFLVALTAHEALVRRRAPVGAVAATVFVYGGITIASTHISADAQAALYLAWSLPALAGMTFTLLAPQRMRALTAPLLSAARAQLPSLARLLTPATPAANS